MRVLILFEIELMHLSKQILIIASDRTLLVNQFEK